MPVIQEHVVNNSMRYLKMISLLVAMDYKIQKYEVQLLEVNSDSFLSTTPQKLNIFLSSFFPPRKRTDLVLSILQISKCLSTYRWGTASCNTAQNWSSQGQSSGDVADNHDHNNHSSDVVQVGAVIHGCKECHFRDNTSDSDQRGGSLSYRDDIKLIIIII